MATAAIPPKYDQVPEGLAVFLLQGVIEILVPIVQPDRNADAEK